MYTTWFLICDRTGARIFENRSPGRELVRISEFSHPESRLQSRELESDRQGRETNKVTTSTRHAFGKEFDAHERQAELFAMELGRHIDLARARHQFDKLVVVSEPRFLGMVKGCLADETLGTLHLTIPKDLSHIPDQDLRHELDHVEELWNDVARYGT